ncbi:MAG TPA: hypothetical protein VHV27_04700 [Phenylobacterium sp.]|nr:hypothetical protein [Phenylobacterium sp.]
MSPAASRLKVGLDVPWVTSWSQERQLGVGPCPSVDGELAIAQADKPGVGRPLYSRNHMFRQRLSVRSMLCPMCGQATEAGDRWSQTAAPTTAGELRARGFGFALPPDMADGRALLNAGAIAPLHRACAEAALARCPHLGGMADKTLKAFPAAWIVMPLWVEAKPPGANARSVRVVSFLQLCGVQDEGAAA